MSKQPRGVATAKKRPPPALTFAEYQKAAAHTDHTGADPQDGILVAVLGLVGESGDLATLFKKRLRDGDSYTVYPAECAEEAGDILWYLATFCTKLGLSLPEIAVSNLAKTKSRWTRFDRGESPGSALDAAFPPTERFPRQFTLDFAEQQISGRTTVVVTYQGAQAGDILTDNSHFDDGYRFHDAFHLAYAAVLGWSPVTRRLLGRKRRSKPEVDEIEDGGRAIIIEEAVSVVVFQYAQAHAMLDGVGHIDSDLLMLLGRLTAGLEVGSASSGEWEKAVLEGYKAYRYLERHGGGSVTADLDKRELTFSRPPTRAK